MSVLSENNKKAIAFYSDAFLLPEGAREFFTETYEKLDCEGKFTEEVGLYENGEIDFETLTSYTDGLSDAKGIGRPEAYGTMLLILCPYVREKYVSEGYGEDLFFETFRDLNYKIGRFYFSFGRYGTNLIKWYKKFVERKRFGLGRLQFEKSTYKGPETEIAGRKIFPGDGLINMHIPRSGEPLTKEAADESFRRAYDFFGGKNGEYLLFGCNSWLIYPPNAEILGSKSNITAFLNNFRIVSVDEHPFDPESCSLYADARYEKPEDLPERTSLQRAYKKRLLGGGLIGSGRGIFLFNGKDKLK